MMRRAAVVCLVGLALAALAGAATTSARSRPGGGGPAGSDTAALVLPGGHLAAGREISVRFLNRGSTPLAIALCASLQHRVQGRWMTITHTHGVDVACPRPDLLDPGPVRPGDGRRRYVSLYDDLVPGTYRLTLPYRPASQRPQNGPFRAGHFTLATADFQVTAFDPGPAPTLSPSRLKAVALRIAGEDGDAHPTLIQDAEGIHALAEVVASGDLVDEWNWTYLIAMRGAFHFHIPTPPGIPMGPGPVVQTQHVISWC